MLPGQKPDFEQAVCSVASENPERTIDRERVARVIDIMYKLAGGEKMGNQFRLFRDSAMNEIGIDDLFRNIATYASKDEVSIQISEEITLTFTAQRRNGKLQWGDVVLARKDIRDGSPHVAGPCFARAKRQAQAIMNSRRQ